MSATTTDRAEVTRAIEATGVVAVVRLTNESAGRAVAEALAAGGVTAIEITMTVPNAVGLIRDLVRIAGPEVIIGAGTVLDAETAKAVVGAGARFVVSPVCHLDILGVCHQGDVVAMPGCFSPTEILAAWDAGADIVKVFPATSLGPGFIKDVRGPLPHVKLMPTGGVTRDNAGDWIRAGAVAIGVGSALVDQALVAAGRFDDIRERARDFVRAVSDARTAMATPARA